MELVHQVVGAAPGGVSAFWDALEKVGRDSPSLDLSCPYVNVDVLERVVASAPNWRLVSDVEEWLASDQVNALRVAAFITANPGRIRDCRMLHAKVVIGEKLALIGSANLTKAGLERRTEMGVLFDEVNTIIALRKWFGEVWEASVEPNAASVMSLAKVLVSPMASAAKNTFNALCRGASLGAAGPKVRTQRSLTASIVPALASAGPLPATKIVGRNRLVARLREMTQLREEADASLDLLRYAIISSGLEAGHPALRAAVPKGDSRIAVILRGKVMIAAWLRRKDGPRVGMVVRPGLNVRHVAGQIIKNIPFVAANSRWYEVPLASFGDVPSSVTASWGARIEKLAARRSVLEAPRVNDPRHSPAAYRAIMDPTFRREILDVAFGKA
jgi:hypothetical protein